MSEEQEAIADVRDAFTKGRTYLYTQTGDIVCNIAELLAAYDDLRTQLAAAREEEEKSSVLIARQAALLTGVVNAIRGKPAPLSKHSHHDAVELVQAVCDERDALLRIAQWLRTHRPILWERASRETGAAAMVTRYTIGDSDDLDAMHRLVNVEYAGEWRWAVRNVFGDCLSVDGEWEHEPLPSSRTDEWLARFRFANSNDAIAAAVRAAKVPEP